VNTVQIILVYFLGCRALLLAWGKGIVFLALNWFGGTVGVEGILDLLLREGSCFFECGIIVRAVLALDISDLGIST